jgi:F-type H+-transporting ATPase subunit delta
MAELATIARPYAEAAFKLAREHSTLEPWSEALAMLEAVTGEHSVRALIGDPNFSRADLERLILGVAGDALSGYARNLVQVLIANGRLELVPQVRALFEALRREHESVLEVEIVSALPVTDEQLRTLVARLEATHQRRVTAKVQIDAALIGGIKIVVGDRVIDATVRGRLEEMAAALAR